VSQDINLKELESKAWRSVFQDGLWDIYLGLLLLAMAVGAWLSDSGFSTALQYGVYLGLIVVSLLILWAGKHFITLPRMGSVKFGPRRQARLRGVRLLLALFLLLGVALFFIALALGGTPSGTRLLTSVTPVIWVLGTLGLSALGAYLLEYTRLVVIGVMYAVTVPADMALRQLTGQDLSYLAFGIPAALILVMGLVVFVRFLHDYPLPAEQESPAAEAGWHGNR